MDTSHGQAMAVQLQAMEDSMVFGDPDTATSNSDSDGLHFVNRNENEDTASGMEPKTTPIH